MSVAEELQAAARAIRAQQAADATFHQRVADLLDQIALTAPLVVHENGNSPFMPPITRKARAVAAAYRNPGWTADGERVARVRSSEVAVVHQAPTGGAR